MLASDHAISDGDVIEARATHATGSEARAAAEAAREHAASRTASVTSAPHRDRRQAVSTSANLTDMLGAAWLDFGFNLKPDDRRVIVAEQHLAI